jgi:MEMO1 family protein
LSNLKAASPNSWEYVDQATQEEEHSLEMHLPYAKLIGAEDCTIVPIMVGDMKEEATEYYAQLLDPYLKAENTIFLVSSDFCHWGKRFQYTPYQAGTGPIYSFIEQLDKKGMNLIENQSFKSFEAYLKETDNTICGRNPIRLLLKVSSS